MYFRTAIGRMAIPAFDGGAWVVAITVSSQLRAGLDLPVAGRNGLLVTALLAAAGQVAIGTVVRLYRGRYWLGTIEEAVNLAGVTVVVGLVLFALNLTAENPWVPPTVPLEAVLPTLALAGLARLGCRVLRERRARPDRRSALRVMVFGAGQGGQQLVRSMLANGPGGYLPVAMIDDDAQLRGRRVAGVTVRGGRDAIADVARATGAELLVIAIPSAGAELVRDIARVADDAGLAMKILPPLSELFRPWVGLADLREIDINDLLGRHQIDTDILGIADRIAGRRVLVTGAGGSIGAELCRQIHPLGPAELIMLDRDESALHAVQLSISGHALLDTSDVVLADIRDAAAIRDIFDARRPDIVFHAAALKHLPMLEQYPAEAWKSNVLGTCNVLDAAEAAGVSTFVNISTDKAADPTSVLGRSKRIGERLVADTAGRVPGRYLSVRFGNVLGSRGSVVTTFASQLATGVPITITHPDVTRFFMTIPEAVQLVVQAAVIGSPGEVLVLDMGAPVRIVDLAHQLMALTGRRATIRFTGLREGEKLHEKLFGSDERADVRPLHPAISHVAAPPVTPASISAAEALFGPAEAMVRLTEPVLPPGAVPTPRGQQRHPVGGAA
jgi:FlaA1/EpsC-like NDP-sugar epimerase